MDQLMIRGKECTSEVGQVCLNSTAECAGAGDFDFIDCEKCGVSIHKICFKLTGDLLKIFQDFEAKNEKFPFTTLCPRCRQFPDKPHNKSVEAFEDKKEKKIKNPLEIDCIIRVIGEHLNIQDLVNIRLVNKLWNQTASRILSKEPRQEQLAAYDVKSKNSDVEKCLQIMKNSNEKKLFQKFSFSLNLDQKQNTRDLKLYNEIVKIASPTYVSMSEFTICISNLREHFVFSSFLFIISKNVVDLKLDFEKITGFAPDPTNFPLPTFSKLKSLEVENLSYENYQFVKMVIENSPSLINLSVYSCNEEVEDFYSDNFIRVESQYCILSEKSAQNLQLLVLQDTSLDFDFDASSFQMKLKTLSLNFPCTQDVQFVKLKSFLSSQNDTLGCLEMQFGISDFLKITDVENFEDLVAAQLYLPKLDNVNCFILAITCDTSDKLCNVDEEIWPVRCFNLKEKLPNLKIVVITYSQSWALSFETGENNCHPGVTDLVLIQWTDGDMTKLAKLFPRVEYLDLKEFCHNAYIDEVIYTELGNLNGWSESLKRIVISCEYYHLENLDFEKLVRLKNLKSIKILKTNCPESDVNSTHFINPNLKPLFKIATLTQVAIKNFKISKGIIEELREKYPSLDYSFYSE